MRSSAISPRSPWPLRAAAWSVAFGGGLMLVTYGCMKNGGGTDLGPSGITSSALGSCELPCQTVDDCRRVAPEPDGGETRPFHWIDCKHTEGLDGGVCVGGTCRTTADCPVGGCVGGGCVAPCLADGGCGSDSRDRCVDGYCVRQSELPKPENCAKTLPDGGPRCECLTNEDCAKNGWPWTSCRGGICRSYEADEELGAAGRACDDNDQCRRYHLAQDMEAQGARMRPGTFPDLASACSPDVEPTHPSACGVGFTCTMIASQAGPLWTKLGPPESGARTVCLPSGCAPAGRYCAYTATSCNTDGDCANPARCGDTPVLWACSDATKDFCKVDTDCKPGLQCLHYRQCAVGGRNMLCIQDSDCGNPNPCTAGSAESRCHPSLRECGKTEDCPKGEECTWPYSGFPGVCLDLACETCAAWMNAHGGTRKCIHGKLDLAPPEIRRPD